MDKSSQVEPLPADLSGQTAPELGPVFIQCPRVILRPLLEADFGPTYLNWLNDPNINTLSQRRAFPVSWDGMVRYNEDLRQQPLKGYNLAMVVKENGKHIGNIALVNIHAVHRCAEIAILIGEPSYWGRGYGSECIYHLCRHAFGFLNLHKIFAGSFNPAFVRAVEKLGWKKEGEFRERIWSDGRYHHQIWMSILSREFISLDQYEEAAT